MMINKMIIRIWLQPPSRPFQQQRPIDPSLTLRVIFLNSIVKTKICQLKTQDPVMTDFLRLAPNPTPPAASPTRSPGSQRGLPASPTSPTKRPRLHLPRSLLFLLLSPKKFPPTWCAASYSAVKISSPIIKTKHFLSGEVGVVKEQCWTNAAAGGQTRYNSSSSSNSKNNSSSNSNNSCSSKNSLNSSRGSSFCSSRAGVGRGAGFQ